MFWNNERIKETSCKTFQKTKIQNQLHFRKLGYDFSKSNGDWKLIELFVVYLIPNHCGDEIHLKYFFSEDLAKEFQKISEIEYDGQPVYLKKIEVI